MGGIIVGCFQYKMNPNPRKIISCGKNWPTCHFYIAKFSCVGLALGWGVRRFHINIYRYMLSNPTDLGKSQTPYQVRYRICRYNERQLIDVTVVRRVRPRAERRCDCEGHRRWCPLYVCSFFFLQHTTHL